MEVKNRFEALYEIKEKTHCERSVYYNDQGPNGYSLEKCIPRKKRLKKRVPWEKELVKEKRNELKKAYLKNVSPTLTMRTT